MRKNKLLTRAGQMIYNLNGLTSLPDIDSMLESANGEKQELVARKSFLEGRIQSSISNISEIQEDLAEVNTAINLFTTELAVLEPGSVNFYKKQAELWRAQARKNMIDVRAMSPGYRELTRQERIHDVAKIDLVVAEIDTYIAALEARRTEIQNS
jgi:hypothetical protein